MRDVNVQINRLLLILGSIFSLFGIRVYYLAIIKHEHHLNEAKKPALRTIIKTPDRGTIRDRFNKPLAVNTISYKIAILYDPIKRLPLRQKVDTSEGTKIIYPRKEAIENLATFLEDYIDQDALAIKDLIHSKATLFPNTPFVLKSEIPEEIFYKLKIKEAKFPGLYMQVTSKRTYPEGKIGSHILGYIGAIGEHEHYKIKESITLLKECLDNQKLGVVTPLPKGYTSLKQCRQELEFLQNKSYTIHSKVGKSGIEKLFDKELKGSIGKDFYLVDHKGNRRCKLPESYDETPGRRILLTISSKLQEHAEQLLSDSEKIRTEGFTRAGKNHDKLPPPWIAGGSIIAMIPETGEVVAMASYPGFDPNDFSAVDKDKALKWLETSEYIGKIFDGLKPLEKDTYNISTGKWEHVEQELTFNFFIDTILSKDSSIKKALFKVGTIHGANFIQNCIEMLHFLSAEKDIHPLIDALYSESFHIQTFHQTSKDRKNEILQTLKSKTSLLTEIYNELDPYLCLIPKNDDKILFLDILRLFCPNHLFDDSLLSETGHESLATYKEFGNAKIAVEKEVLEITKNVFHNHEFADWRKEYFKDYLKGRREEEKAQKKHALAYITYLEEVEKSLFDQFFTINKWEFIQAYLTIGAPVKEGDIRLPYFQALIEKSLHNTHPSYVTLKAHLLNLPEEQIIPYLKTMRSFSELNRPLYGKYYFPFKSGKEPTEQALARAFYPGSGFGFSKSNAFVDNTPLGSSFKLFIGFEALMNYYNDNKELTFPLNPMTIIDKSPPYSTKLTKDSVLGYHLDYTPIKRIYKGGRLPRGHQNIGKVDFIDAMAKSSNLYYSLLASNVIKDPSTIISTAKNLGFGYKTGIDLPGEVKGSLPSDILTNKTSLYSFAIGQHSLIVTPLQAAVAISALVNDGKVLKPQIVKAIVNVEPAKDPQSILFKNSFQYEKQLQNIGIFFPIFPQGESSKETAYIFNHEKEVKTTINIPEPVHRTLMQSLYDVVNSSNGTAHISKINSLINNPHKKGIYKKVMNKMGGKTSTAEIAYNPTLDREMSPVITKNIWFTAVSFEDTLHFIHPDLVVVVHLRFGSGGKEAAPLAASMIEKWHAILEAESQKNSGNICNNI